MNDSRRLCRLDDIPDGDAIAAHVDSHAGGFEVIVLRRGDAVYAYHNECPHAGRGLDFAPGRFLVRDGRVICAAHGITGAVLVPAGGAPKAQTLGLLTVETGPVFTLEDESAVIARLLDAMDAGQSVEVSRDVTFDGVYGPSLKQLPCGSVVFSTVSPGRPCSRLPLTRTATHVITPGSLSPPVHST